LSSLISGGGFGIMLVDLGRPPLAGSQASGVAAM
jgi:hypothetical protein